MPISVATSVACNPPAPPKLSSAKSRGSNPFSNSESRTAAPRLALTTVTMPCAASSVLRPSGVPTRAAMAARVAVMSSFIAPPRK